jgi:hypothetical protein
MACVISAAGNVCQVCEEITVDRRIQEYYAAKPRKDKWNWFPDTSKTEFRTCDICKEQVPPPLQEACRNCKEGVHCRPCHWRATFACMLCMSCVRAPDASTFRYAIAKHLLAKKAKIAKRIHKMQRKRLICYMPNCNHCQGYNHAECKWYVNYCCVCGARNPHVVLKCDLDPALIYRRGRRFATQYRTSTSR